MPVKLRIRLASIAAHIEGRPADILRRKLNSLSQKPGFGLISRL